MADKKKNTGVKESNPTLLACIYAAAITLVTFVVFSSSLNNGFTNWDDDDYVIHDPMVAANSLPLVKIFETPVAANYHPLTILSLALNYQHGKLNPFGYHLGNLILHLLNTILVFIFIFLLTRRNLLMASIVALFFGIHPMHVESVAWVSERKDVLYVFFFLLGLITYLRYKQTKKTGWYIATFLFFIFSCLSKGMAVVFPVILVLVDYLQGAKRNRKLLIEKIPFFLLSIVFGIIAIKAQQTAVITLKAITVFQRLVFASYGAIMYIVRFFVPFKLSAFYPYPSIHDPNGISLIYYLSPFILIGIASVVIYFFMKKEKEITFGLLFCFVTLILVLQFMSVGYAIMADRYSYLSYIGLSFVTAFIINKAWVSKSGVWALLKYPLMLVMAVGAILFSCQTYSRTKVWNNSGLLWANVIDNYSNASLAYKGLGDYYRDNNEMEKAMYNYTEAVQVDSFSRDGYYNRGVLYDTHYHNYGLSIADYTKAIQIDSTYAKAYNNRGLVYLTTGKTGLALIDFNKAIELDPAFDDAYNNRGLLYLNTGQTNLARADFNKDIILNPDSVKAYNNRGLLYLRCGENDSALIDYTKAIALDPALACAYGNRGLIYMKTGKPDLAMTDFNKALQLNPKDSDTYFNRGLLYSHSGKNDLAINDFAKVIEIAPAYLEAYNERGLLYLNTGKINPAITDFKKGIALNSTHADIYANLGLLYYRCGKIDSAIIEYDKSIERNRSSAPCYFDRGLCYKQLNKYAKALDDFTKATQLNPSVADFWLNRSIAEAKTGQNEQAKADALKAQQLQVK